MEVHPGVFVSRTDTQDWRFDPEVGGEMHVLVEAEGGYAGMSRFVTDLGPEAWMLPEREVLIVLEGAAHIVGAGLAIWLLNLLIRIGISGERDRDAEDEARAFFDEHGYWPDEAPDEPPAPATPAAPPAHRAPAPHTRRARPAPRHRGRDY